MGAFQKQLTTHGFECVNTGKGCNAYCHQHFVRGKPEGLLSFLKADIKELTSTPKQEPVEVSCDEGPLDEEKEEEDTTLEKGTTVDNDKRAIKSPKFQPLVVPGRLRHQPAANPTALRFVPVPNQSKFRQTEFRRWNKPVQLKPICTELDHHNWLETKPEA